MSFTADDEMFKILRVSVSRRNAQSTDQLIKDFHRLIVGSGDPQNSSESERKTPHLIPTPFEDLSAVDVSDHFQVGDPLSPFLGDDYSTEDLAMELTKACSRLESNLEKALADDLPDLLKQIMIRERVAKPQSYMTGAGLSVLQTARMYGSVKVVEWLVKECGAEN
jgi:hypothetical protein